MRPTAARALSSIPDMDVGEQATFSRVAVLGIIGHHIRRCAYCNLLRPGTITKLRLAIVQSMWGCQTTDMSPRLRGDLTNLCFSQG